jgi:hypothetical protein
MFLLFVHRAFAIRLSYDVNFHIYIFSSEANESNYTNPGREGPLVGLSQNYVLQPCLQFKMAVTESSKNIHSVLNNVLIDNKRQ